MADIGYIAQFLALVVSVYAAGAFILGWRGKHPALLSSARNGLLASCGLLTISVASLVYALVSHDFQIEYVYQYTSRDLALTYRLSALWAGNDGSLLFWAWLLSVLGAAVILQKREVGKELVPYAAAIIGVTQTFFILLLLTIANPFQKLPQVPADGMGLNPMLENPGMFFHPPLLLAGYVGFTVPFAFAMAALLSRRLGDAWLIVVRRWTLLAWLSLGLGNLLGAWWAYVELGWGGYWAWDPVENAGLMPWLVATAFLHSIMMQRRRGILKVWNMVLIILTFVLAILGTFLTRSGVLASVHTFAESPLLGASFLAFIGITIVSSLGLLYYRSEELKSEAEMESLVSRESTFLLNNLLLVGAAFTIFLGTFFPVISEAVRGVKVSVGPPFYNQVNVPIFLAIILLAGICTLIGWRRASLRNLVQHFLWPLATALILGIVLFILGIRQWLALVALPLCGFVLFTILYEWWRGTRARHRMRSENYLKAFWGLIMTNRPRYGGYIVHIGVIIMAVGIIGSSLYGVEKEATLTQGESMSIEDYTLTYENMDFYETESKAVVTATLLVSNQGKLLGRLLPEKYFHRSFEQPVTEVAIRSTLVEDLYVILVGWDEDGTTAFKVLVNPLVNWIWIGGVVLVLGGLIAFWPEWRRQPVPQSAGKRGE
ncbi:MAG TPA: heme lyase CcmF/NrfE family subunit [Dehalococcoidia bacterium]|jgi:cytochrome c-type biogenesis protein CcmF|nr:heme lyase CcmF/NrfE family subunit [Dehalococcoidia bacterium]